MKNKKILCVFKKDAAGKWYINKPDEKKKTVILRKPK